MSIKPHVYDKKLNGMYSRCSHCKIIGIHSQHHIGRRRYNDLVIWLCHKCHDMVHRDSKFGYENNLLVKHNSMAKSKKDKKKDAKTRSKKCKHKTYFNKDRGGFICIYCSKLLDKLT